MNSIRSFHQAYKPLICKIEEVYIDKNKNISQLFVYFLPVQGRHTVAREDIQVGEVIACEDANVSFTHFNTNTHESKACHHCVGVLGINKHPSPVVPGIYFCSFPCFLEAIQTYHLHEKKYSSRLHRQVKFPITNSIFYHISIQYVTYEFM